MTSPASQLLDWGWAGAPLEGPESGDLHVVVSHAHGALVAVIDALGHGPDAAAVAREVSALLCAAPTLPLDDLVRHCHEGLRTTRGAVMSVALFDPQQATVDWCGVGNVEGVLFRADSTLSRPREALSTRGGVIGYRLPPLKVTRLPIARGDVLVLATDGIDVDFPNAVDVQRAGQEIADGIFVRHAKTTDDALVLAARYLGGSP